MSSLDEQIAAYKAKNPVKAALAALMRDGRERTVGEITDRLRERGHDVNTSVVRVHLTNGPYTFAKLRDKVGAWRKA